MVGNETTCKDINEYTLKFVMDNWLGPKSSLDRYKSVGQHLTFLDDKVE